MEVLAQPAKTLHLPPRQLEEQPQLVSEDTVVLPQRVAHRGKNLTWRLGEVGVLAQPATKQIRGVQLRLQKMRTRLGRKS